MLFDVLVASGDRAHTNVRPASAQPNFTDRHKYSAAEGVADSGLLGHHQMI